ncbi:MAG: PHP domain-containing protein [Deltaproteobacteria bacterium]|jgi:predicted metal-dependent phosphoesterase TrpH|nr:PHP domain-containing protein [Deltaproteobacteria bacterium]
MIIDLHVHEAIFSGCSRMSLEDAVTSARYRGLDAVCITNHDSLAIAGSDVLQTMDFPVFVGVELTTWQGDMLAFGLESLPSFKPSAQEFIDFVAGQNGFSCAAHPFRAWNDGLGHCLGSLRGLDGVEVLNGGNDDEANSQAWQACKRLGLAALGGSDAHRNLDVGRYATWFPGTVTSMRELIQTMKSGRCHPVMRHADGMYGVWDDSLVVVQDTPLSWMKKKLRKIL